MLAEEAVGEAEKNEQKKTGIRKKSGLSNAV